MEYSPAIAQEVCQHLVDGKSLRQIAKVPNMPNTWLVLEWLEKFDDFARQYARARDLQAENFADSIVAISDDESIPADQKRIMVDSRKWIAAKLKPKKYGDRQIVDQNVTVTLADLVSQSYAPKVIEQVSVPAQLTATTVNTTPQSVEPRANAPLQKPLRTNAGKPEFRVDGLVVEGEEELDT